jgi:hypothetical protein
MRKFWRKVASKFAAKKLSPPDSREWIAVYLKLSGGEYGSREEQDEVRSFARELDGAIRKHGVGSFDGDEFGNNEAGLFMYGQDADRLFEAIEPLLRSWSLLDGGYAIKRYGEPSRSERVQF